jgi:hypothetical protein
MWAKKLLQQIWGHFFAVWKSRCEARHEVDTDRISRQHKYRVQARVRVCYTQIDQLPADTRAWFPHNILEAKLHDNKMYQLEVWWLAHADPLVKQGLAEAPAQAAVATGHLRFRHFFPAISAGTDTTTQHMNIPQHEPPSKQRSANTLKPQHHPTANTSNQAGVFFPTHPIIDRHSRPSGLRLFTYPVAVKR